MRPRLEGLEDRLAPSVTTINVNDNADKLDNPTTVTAATLGANVTLRDAINAANNSGGGNSYVINLQANTTYDLITIDNYWYGPDGLPGVFSDITINGSGATIQRDSSAPNFRLFFVSGGLDGPPPGSLTLENLTLQGGVAQGGSSHAGGGGLGAGGAIFSQGTLTLTGVTLSNNQAVGGSSGLSGSSGGGGGMGQNAASTNGGGFGGSLNVPTGYTGSIGGSGGSSGSSSGGGGGGFGTADAGANGSSFNGGAGGGKGGFGGRGGNFSGTTYSGDGGGGAYGTGLGYPGYNGGRFGSGGAGSTSASGGGGGGIGGGGGGGLFCAGGGGGGFGGGGGDGGYVNGGFGGFGGGGGGSFFSNTTAQGGFGGGNGATGSYFTSTGGGGGGMGGAIFNMMGSLTITNSTLSGNAAVGGSGANGGSGYGGAIFNLDGTLNITFGTLADNTVSGAFAADGGAVYNLAYGNNPATGGAQSATTSILDSILSNSIGGSDLVNNVVNGANSNTATVFLSGPNLIMSTSGALSGAPTVTANPQLGPLQNNAGPTPTMALTASSPAYQAGIAVVGITTDQRGANRLNPPTLGAYEVEPATTIADSDVTTTFSTNPQSLTLKADVTSAVGTVNVGTVTFTILQGNTVIGSATTSGTVNNGQASVNYILPANTATGNYTIDAVYNNNLQFSGSSDTSHTLTVTPANATTVAGNVTTFYSPGPQNVSLNATLTDDSISGDTVDDGSVTFTVKSGAKTIGSVSATVAAGTASANFALAAAQAVGSYTIDVSYSDSAGNFIDIGDSSGTLTVSPANIATTANKVSTVYSLSSQTVTLSAVVADTSIVRDIVNEGTVTFTVMDGGASLGSVSDTVSKGTASAAFTLLAGQAAGNYTIDVAYSDSSGNFIDAGDTSAPLVIAPAKATTVAANDTTAFRPGAQNVTLTAAVSSPIGPVNEGTVTFTVMQGNTVIGAATTSGTVSNGQASVSYALPAATTTGNYTVAVTYSDGNGNFSDSGDSNATLTINPAKAVTTALNASAPHSTNPQSLTLNATIADDSFATDTVDEGTVTFTILKGLTPLGSVSGTVSGGTANANFTLPAGLTAGSYSIGVSYGDTPSNFSDSDDFSGTLTISAANVTVTAAAPPTVGYSSTAQSMTLSASVVDTTISTDIVNEGSVVFTVLKDGSAIQSIAGAVSNGTASVNFTLPPGATAGIYTVDVAYTDSPGNFTDSGDTDAFLTVANAGAVITANNVAATYSPKSQAVMLSASVANSSDAADTVDQGVVKFTILNGSTPLGSVQSGVINGNASAGFLLPAGQARGSYTIAVSYSDSQGNLGDSSNQSGTLTISPVTVDTTANSVSTFYSPNTQILALSAKVANLNFPSDTIGEGSVAFTVTGGGMTLGSVSGTVSGGTANANFTLPAAQAVGKYSIQVVYSDSSGNYIDSGDQSATLTVAPAHVATTANKLSTVYNSSTAQTLALSATLADASIPSDTVGEGTVTFTVSSGNATLGSVPATVSGGKAGTNFILAAGQAAGSYTIAVSYADSQGNFRDSGDTSSVLTVSPANVATTADSASAVYSNNRQIIQLSASVANASAPSDTVNEGVVTFAIQSGGKTVASALGKVSGGTANPNIALPAGLAPGSYTIAVGYSDVFGNFQDSGDQSANLMVATSNVTATAAAATAVYSTSAQTVALNANVVDASVPSDIVNEGTVVFTVTNGGTVVGSTQGTVSGGKASATITLPAGLAAGNYGLTVRYGDGPGKLVDIGDSNAVLSVGPAGVTVAAAAANTTFSTTPQIVTLSAAVAGSGVVGEGDVFFTVLDGNTAVASAVGAVNSGTANANVSLPGGLAGGNYGLAVRYLDGQGNLVETGNSNAALSIGAASTTVSLLQASLTPNYFSLTDTETLTAHVSGSTAVTEGTVTFYLSNMTVTANVDGNGNATAVITLPMLDLLSPQSISIGYSDAAGNLTGSSNGQSAQWQFINALLPSTATFSPNSETVTADMFGLFITYTNGRLTEIDYGSIDLVFG